jgi:CheY-like chemotaxis protein
MVSNSLRILVVDDNQDTAQSMGELLEILGHQAQVAYDGPKAVEMATAFQPQVVLLDIGLPIIDGYEVARRMRQAGLKDAMLVALTGYGREEDREKAHQAGFDMHFTKPIELDALQKVLAKKMAEEE